VSANGDDVTRTPRKLRVRSFFVYRVTFLAVAPAAIPSDVIRFDSQSDFLWIKAAYQADIAAATQTDGTRVVPNVDVQLQSGGSDKNLFQAPVPIPSVFGYGALPFVLPFPHRFARTTELTVSLTNRDAAATYNIRLAFIGWKDYGALEV
jgi:hypothetical protein